MLDTLANILSQIRVGNNESSPTKNADSIDLSSAKANMSADCTICRITSSAILLASGGYLVFSPSINNYPTANRKGSLFYKDVNLKHISYVYRGSKILGFAFMALGFMRAGDGVLWRQNLRLSHY